MTVSRTSRRSATAIAAAASALALGSIAGPAMADTAPGANDPANDVDPPSSFTGAYIVNATPDTIINNDGDSVPGKEGAEGTFLFFTSSTENIICWDISVTGLEDIYESPAKTATHIHEADAGEPGPPRIAFPDPEPADSTDPAVERTSSGCAEGPFTTGLAPEGTDTGDGFTLDQIEANPAGFSADTHTADAVAGAVRGQLVFSQELLDQANASLDEDDDADDERQTPVGGVRTGEGGSATSLPLGLMAAFTVAAAGAGAVALRRRQSA
ncbi:hypothetical protein GCM10009821_14880 [Aeromicrobium halocynthiae]|uniref:CHRD domain-containing protein n=1 Tax=Aeromicrobium halocynthiae TaxID=560557 RepID=A0ABP5HJK6_9ACTN